MTICSTNTELAYFSHSLFNSLPFRHVTCCKVTQLWGPNCPKLQIHSLKSLDILTKSWRIPWCNRDKKTRPKCMPPSYGELPRLLRLISLSVVIEKRGFLEKTVPVWRHIFYIHPNDEFPFNAVCVLLGPCWENITTIKWNHRAMLLLLP